MLKRDFRFREIPYNFTSFSDKEIIQKYFDEKTWDLLNELRLKRITGRSAKLINEIIGDIFIIERNPYLFDDFLKNKRRLKQLRTIHEKRIETVVSSSNKSPLVDILIEKTKKLDEEFFLNFGFTKSLRQKITYSLTGTTSRKNIHFSPFHRVSHATDATDWRVEYPFVVIYPGKISEIPKIIKTAKKLGLSIIPRGGGTGLTAGAVPVNKNTMIINTERLNKINDIEIIEENEKNIPIVNVEAGVITDDIIEYCEKHDYIFATDPTSAWASTIGGNIAENAGGKKCVMWGTAIDNLYSFNFIDPNGDIIKVKRYHHPYRKILPDDIVEFDLIKCEKKKETFIKRITISGTEIRKKGLGKDITNKALGGLPGIQKEGGDGIIVSAQFILYKPFQFCKTLCLEFFGSNMVKASRAIVAIQNEFSHNDEVYLTALEHFDEKYVSAINYRNKSGRDDIPKAVLLIDIESENDAKLSSACNRILEIIKDYNAEGILAKDERERKSFWNDRKHLGAIAKHTNAFKLNEDIVIPLDRLPDFADFIELLNYKKTIKNHININNNILEYLNQALSENPNDFPIERSKTFIKRLESVNEKYIEYAGKLEKLRDDAAKINREEGIFFRQLQDGIIKITFDEDVVIPFRQVFHGYDNIQNTFNSMITAECGRKIIIATHMHAGDGNVHVNIPVHSSDYLMMQEADETAGMAMREAIRLGGVISGEHGIGLTKLKFIDKETLDKYQEYKKENDPDDLFNPGKLNSSFPLSRIYTPSFNLLECEAIILESTDLEQLSTAIASCVRCGKCKSVCNTHYPNGTLLYNPRNKILAVGLITEAVLFSAQTLDMKSFKHFKNLREIADHCTVCHKCQVPCPVKIDFGEISLTMRSQLIHRKKSAYKLFTNVSLYYLGRKKYFINKIMRISIFRIGYALQRVAAYINKPFVKQTSKVFHKLSPMLSIPFPDSGRKTFREILNLKGQNTFYCFENSSRYINKNVLYFPGCGSERMFPEISMAVMALLYYSGVRVVITPDYLCCGYPFMANGKTGQSEIKSYENRVLFHRIADTAGYMNFDAVLVSCGTCLEMLQKYEVENIFNGCQLLDINEFIIREKLYAEKNPAKQIPLYHEPCHTPLKRYGYEKTFKELFDQNVEAIPNCCGEAGTLALSRPDIAGILRERKAENINNIDNSINLEILTTCPSCVLGLSKINHSHKITGKSLAVYNAEQFIGKDWQKKFIKDIKKSGVEKILL
jgi:FAD/FMN-containing dehydrogenase/Fe-S oxidoreductase